MPNEHYPSAKQLKSETKHTDKAIKRLKERKRRQENVRSVSDIAHNSWLATAVGISSEFLLQNALSGKQLFFALCAEKRHYTSAIVLPLSKFTFTCCTRQLDFVED